MQNNDNENVNLLSDADSDMPICKNLGKPYNMAMFLQMLPNHEEKYKVTQHFTTTEDGYHLRMFRITLNQAHLEKLPEHDKQNINRPILLIHGNCSSSDAFLLGGESNSVFLYLVNRGFDVWFANYRGNKYGLSHNNTEISAKDFYDYTMTEIGIYDIPAFYQKIFKVREDPADKKIILFGYSQGTAEAFIGLTDPKSSDYLNDRTEIYFAQGPSVFMTYVDNKINKFLSGYQKALYNLINFFGVNSFNSEPKYEQTYYESYLSWWWKKFPSRKIAAAEGEQDFDPKVDILVDVYETWRFRGLSGKNAKCDAHYLQLIGGDKDGKPMFRKFNYYDEKMNTEKYGQATPPDFDFSKVRVKVCAFAGTADPLSTKENIDELKKRISAEHWNLKMVDDWKHPTVFIPKDMSPIKDYIHEHLNLQN